MSKQKKIDPTWLSIKLEEYRSLREEIVDCGSSSISILSFGILSISGLLSFALTNELLAIYIFLLICPIICYLMLFIWLGEIARIFRAASYIRENIEEPIKKHYKDLEPPIYWEHWLREESEVRGKKRLYKWHRIATVILSIAAALFSAYTGISRYHSQFTNCQIQLLIASEIVVFIIVVITILLIYKNISKW